MRCTYPSAYLKLDDFFTIQSNVTPVMILLYNEANIRTIERKMTRVSGESRILR